MHPPPPTDRRAYPRWRGGNVRPCLRARAAWGLSPLARGKHVKSCFG